MKYESEIVDSERIEEKRKRRTKFDEDLLKKGISSSSYTPKSALHVKPLESKFASFEKYADAFVPLLLEECAAQV